MWYLVYAFTRHLSAALSHNATQQYTFLNIIRTLFWPVMTRIKYNGNILYAYFQSKVKLQILRYARYNNASFELNTCYLSSGKLSIDMRFSETSLCIVLPVPVIRVAAWLEFSFYLN